MATHKDLVVYQKSLDFVELIYSVTKEFPSEEQFGLVSQLRRASVCIPSVIAEGYQRKTIKERIQFLYVAYGSCAEIETQLAISDRLGFVDKNVFPTLTNALVELSKMLRSLIRSFEQRPQ